MPRISTEDKIKQLEAKIADIKARAERQKVRKNPSIKFMKAGLRSIENAMRSTDDAVLRKSLDDARANVSACLSLSGVTARGSKSVLNPRPRGTDNGAAPDANDLLGYLKKHPGAKSEQISAALSTDAIALRKTLQPLMDDGKVRTEGQKRGRRYFAGV